MCTLVRQVTPNRKFCVGNSEHDTFHKIFRRSIDTSIDDLMSALSLYRSILRTAQPLPYNFRMYTRRRARDHFEASRSLSPNSSEAEQALAFGKDQLKLVKRQAVTHGMFASDPLVVEVCEKYLSLSTGE
ncbi:hypothetical protein PYCC9005_001300 [Savitreella phatthalungensis]